MVTCTWRWQGEGKSCVLAILPFSPAHDSHTPISPSHLPIRPFQKRLGRLKEALDEHAIEVHALLSRVWKVKDDAIKGVVVVAAQAREVPRIDAMRDSHARLVQKLQV